MQFVLRQHAVVADDASYREHAFHRNCRWQRRGRIDGSDLNSRLFLAGFSASRIFLRQLFG